MTIYSLNRIGYTFILYSIYFGFVLGDILTIWNSEYKGTYHLFGVPIKDIVLILVLIFFFIDRKMIFTRISKKVICLYIVIIIYYTLQGIIVNGFSGATRVDLRYFLWFLGGISFGSVLVRTGEIRRNLEIITVVTAILMLAAALFGDKFQSAVNFQIIDYGRISEMGIYVFAGLLYTPLILCFNLKSGSWQNHAVPLLGISILIFAGVFLANARSMAIILTVILLLYILSFGIQSNGIVINRIKTGKYLCFAFVVGIIGALLFVYALSVDVRLERILNISAEAIGKESRYLEAILFYEQGITDDTLVFGKGFGGTVISPISGWDETAVMHIGILNVWMKMGLGPFILISIYIFIVLPSVYVINLIKRTSFYNYTRTANLIIIPSLFPWIMNLAMSGGYSPQDSIFVGVAYMIYREIRINGLRRILN